MLLINQCCSLITLDNPVLIRKCSKIIKHLINSQHINVEGRTLTIAIQWCLKAFKANTGDVLIDILQALDALLRKKIHNVNMVIIFMPC